MSQRPYFLGVDGGGTKTEFLCIDRTGAEVARHIGPTTYHLQVGLAGVEAALKAGIESICAALSAVPEDFAQIFFGLPAFGEDSRIDPQLVSLCGALLGHDRYACGNDMVCGWAGSLACADGINLVAGTGSIGYGERRGRSARAGGWGERFGDEGSAYWIAIQGLNAFTRMSDGRLPKGPLHARFRAALSIEADLDICAKVMGEHGMSREAIAALAPVVAQAVADDDPAAAAIHDQAARELAQIAGSVRSALGFEAGEPAPLSWSGGILTSDRSVRTRLEHALDDIGGYVLIEPRHSPAYGAALYAARMRGLAIGAAAG